MSLPLHLPLLKEGLEPYLAYGAAGKVQSLGRGRTLRLGLFPLLASIALPWGFFALTYIALASSVHYIAPWQTVAAVVGGAFVLLCFFFAWLDSRYKGGDRQNRSMLVLYFFYFFLAWTVGLGAGSASYTAYTEKWFELTRLNIYKGVDPDVSRGAQLMDAGAINFLPGTHVMLNMSMGFQDRELWCAAPLQRGDLAPVTFDFWLVGKGCCQASRPGFHCGSARHPHGDGLDTSRAMEENDLRYYKLAVKQAEAAYGIVAAQPLFLHFLQPEEVQDPALLEGQAQQSLKNWLLGYLVFQSGLSIFALIFVMPVPRTT
mmetsp:Transcript_33592/g.62958  ORF Transcript_33592/g.62958 Transcript_33592/m.62958 type:complete len:317 (+) Transcript_33592:69-1019(+)